VSGKAHSPAAHCTPLTANLITNQGGSLWYARGTGQAGVPVPHFYVSLYVPGKAQAGGEAKSGGEVRAEILVRRLIGI